MSLANIQGKLSRAEMKSIMAGSGSDGALICVCSNGADAAVASCDLCFNYCNTAERGGISCTQGDCTNYPNG